MQERRKKLIGVEHVHTFTKLVESLDVLSTLQRRHSGAIRARELSRTHRDRLLQHGFLIRIMKLH
jgi:hypothetical protein